MKKTRRSQPPQPQTIQPSKTSVSPPPLIPECDTGSGNRLSDDDNDSKFPQLHQETSTSTSTNQPLKKSHSNKLVRKISNQMSKKKQSSSTSENGLIFTHFTPL